MFIGHFAVGLAAKRVSPAVSLGVLFGACQLADLLWPNFLLTGLERVEVEPGNTAFTPLNFVSYPYSHSLVALLLWSVLAGVLYRLLRRSTRAAAGLVALVIVSHWVLDVVTHRPDVPLTISGQARVGLGLWNSVGGTIAVETAMFAAGLILYVRSTRPLDRVGSVGFWSLVGFLVVTYVTNIVGPPPPSPAAVMWTVQAMWLIVFWAYWVDGHRASTSAASTKYTARTKYKVRSTKY